MRIAILGSALAGGALQIVDILHEDAIADSIRIYDDNPESLDREILGEKIVGDLNRVIKDADDKLIDCAIVGVGSIGPRKAIFNRFQDCFLFPNIISKKSVVSQTARLGDGNVILPMAYIGPNTTIGNNNYITTGTMINHDSVVGSNCYFSTSVSVAGRVTIGNEVRLDTGSLITADAKIGDGELLLPGKAYGPIRGL